MSKHTPGPISVVREGSFHLVEDYNGNTVAQCEFEADAVLYAAAPELLATLKKIYALGHARPEPWIKSLIDEIETAIAKAEGRNE